MSDPTTESRATSVAMLVGGFAIAAVVPVTIWHGDLRGAIGYELVSAGVLGLAYLQRVDAPIVAARIAFGSATVAVLVGIYLGWT